MAKVIVTVTIMPASPDVDLKSLEEASKKIVSDGGGDVGKVVVEPVAFGLKSIKLIFVADESVGSPDPMAESIAKLTDVNSAEITDVRRAIG